jgi:hypothetical protein
MHGAMPPLPNTSSWRGAWLRTGTTSPLPFILCNIKWDDDDDDGEGWGKNRAWPIMRYYSNICLEILVESEPTCRQRIKPGSSHPEEKHETPRNSWSPHLSARQSQVTAEMICPDGTKRIDSDIKEAVVIIGHWHLCSRQLFVIYFKGVPAKKETNSGSSVLPGYFRSWNSAMFTACDGAWYM